jgi:hypothetical protein
MLIYCGCVGAGEELSFASMPRQILRGADADAVRLARHHSPFAPGQELALTLKDKGKCRLLYSEF